MYHAWSSELTQWWILGLNDAKQSMNGQLAIGPPVAAQFVGKVTCSINYLLHSGVSSQSISGIIAATSAVSMTLAE